MKFYLKVYRSNHLLTRFALPCLIVIPMFCNIFTPTSHHFPCFAQTPHSHFTIASLFYSCLFQFTSYYQVTMSLWVLLPTLLWNPQFTNPSISFIIDISFVPIISSSIIAIATSFVDSVSSHTTIVSRLWHFTITKSFTTNTSSCSTMTISHFTSLSLALTLPHTWSIVILQRRVLRAKCKTTTKKRNP